MSNLLVQHRELSLLAIGAAAHIQSLPEGAPVSIRALAERFPETEHRIGRALRELEAAGFLRRTRLRTVEGKVVTRTVSYNLPLVDVPPETETDSEPEPEPDPDPEAEPELEPEPEPGPEAGPPGGDVPPESAAPVPVPDGWGDLGGGLQERVRPVAAGRTPVQREAAALLAGLRVREPRLLLSERDVERLVPGVVEWLERGAAREAVRRALTADVPSDLRNPAGLIAYRLRASIPALLPALEWGPIGSLPPDRPRVPFQTCDGCERAFRSPTPGRCRDCRGDGRAAA
ncbi:helix-turn-helix domain-containing protein [Streptomyces sp. NPDC032472]|uniref:helix-turn-helix domain-containing protein n=1 Tax=Streptomyces sp. NPDC032472 TaxID=3155018 RepID=UPI0033D81687